MKLNNDGSYTVVLNATFQQQELPHAKAQQFAPSLRTGCKLLSHLTLRIFQIVDFGRV